MEFDGELIRLCSIDCWQAPHPVTQGQGTACSPEQRCESADQCEPRRFLLKAFGYKVSHLEIPQSKIVLPNGFEKKKTPEITI